MLETYEKVIIGLFAFAMIAGVGFWDGTHYEAGMVRSTAALAPGTMVPPPSGLPGSGTGSSASTAPKIGSQLGQISAVSASGFTVKTPDGKEHSVTYAASTTVQITKTSFSTEPPSALKVGDNVMAIGSLGSDGTLAAQSVNVSVTSGHPAESTIAPVPPPAGMPATSPSQP